MSKMYKSGFRRSQSIFVRGYTHTNSLNKGLYDPRGGICL